jgi:hypothetical protein
MRRRRYDRKYAHVIATTVIILLMGISVYFQIQGAAQCAADGGEYLRNWANWPVCIGGK